MSVLAQALGQDAQPHTLECNGKVFTLSLIDQRMKTSWSQWLFDRACKACAAMRSALTPAEYAERLENLNQQYLSGDYDFESEVTMDVLRTKAGMLQLIVLVFGATREEAVTLLRVKPAEVKQRLDLIMALSFPAVEGQGDADPNALTPGSGFALLRQGSGRSSQV